MLIEKVRLLCGILLIFIFIEITLISIGSLYLFLGLGFNVLEKLVKKLHGNLGASLQVLRAFGEDVKRSTWERGHQMNSNLLLPIGFQQHQRQPLTLMKLTYSIR
jgi:hypothetical protein